MPRKKDTKKKATAREAATKKGITKKKVTKKTSTKKATRKTPTKKLAAIEKTTTSPQINPADPTASLQYLSLSLSNMPPGEKKDKMEIFVKERWAEYDKYKADNPHLFPDPVLEASMSDADKRVRYLKTWDLTNRVYQPGDIKNHAAVINAYQTGQLDPSKRQPGEVALFWGGIMKRGWGGLDEVFEKGPPKWMAENPDGKLWVENVVLENERQY
ncbi:hypothetical protein BJ508DRAFT_335043 [Ascobolus immersus RN42]|uniref:Uncharacterized protein n=1 Tax=Ascobolus immersus RN42 TaxID=1160509 RepID=A0A3N4HDX9_ASCIM|nr:hypothetical protein BJ508DRAFT_335043 [Ascobolus immersus RN42]